MTKIICSLFMITLLASTKLIACVCSPQTVSDYFQHSQFVAKAKILKVTPDSANNDYHDADIELITLYKGERRAKIKILSVRNSSCFFLPSVNSTWIIFASVSGGTLSFGSCSGSLNLIGFSIQPSIQTLAKIIRKRLH